MREKKLNKEPAREAGKGLWPHECPDCIKASKAKCARNRVNWKKRAEAAEAKLDWLMVQGIRGIAPGWVGIPEVEWDSTYPPNKAICVSERAKTPETDRVWADCGNTDPLTAAQRMRDHAWRLESERDEYKASADLARRAADVANFEACRALFGKVTLRYRLRRMVRIALRYRRQRDFARMEANWAARREHRAERQRIEMRGKLAECQGQLYRGRKVEGADNA